MAPNEAVCVIGQGGHLQRRPRSASGGR